MPSYSCSRRVLVAAVHDDDGLGQRPERAHRDRAVVRVRAQHRVRVAVLAVDDLVEDVPVEGEDRAHASFASCGAGMAGESGRVIRAMAAEGDGQPGRPVACLVDRLVDGLVGV